MADVKQPVQRRPLAIGIGHGLLDVGKRHVQTANRTVRQCPFIEERGAQVVGRSKREHLGRLGIEVDMQHRSEERRVGKEGVSMCRSRWSPDHSKKKKQNEVDYVNTERMMYKYVTRQ